MRMSTKKKVWLATRKEVSDLIGCGQFTTLRNLVHHKYPHVITEEGQAAVLRLSHNQIGDKYVLCEDFKVTYNKSTQETWMQYIADGRMIAGFPRPGDAPAPDGVYGAKSMATPLSRCDVELTSIGFEKIERISRRIVWGNLPANAVWYWKYTFKRI